DRLSKILASDEKGTLFLVNINSLTTVNDIFGHLYGDILLRTMAERIGDALPRRILVGRLSGSDFAAIIRREDASTEMEQEIANRLLVSLTEPIKIQGTKIRIAINIGITHYPEDGDTVTDILKNADVAMHYSKQDGKSRYTIFDGHMTTEIINNLTLETKLHDAVHHDDFILYYQPQVRVRDQSLAGFEGLIRWPSAHAGFIGPDKFIPLAEETGLIVPMGYAVIEKACQFINRHQPKSITPYKVSVNISAVQLLQSDFVERVMEIVGKTGVSPHHLGLEITESALIRSYISNVEKLDELKKNGFVILLDDFGTGYSSLNHLQNLPIDILKIDKSFMDKITEQKKALNLASSIITMAHNLNLTVVAEGIETEEQLHILEDFNCDVIQGYYFSKPLPEEQASGYEGKMKKQNRR
ncbi:MAG TPA: bifunctional diguanylate cyclase/phosphodiesterase, partial [Spirochaetota bacterium]